MSFDTVEENAAFAEKFSFPFKLLCDTERELGLAYGACDSRDAGAAKRISYLIDPEGKVAKSWGTTSKLVPREHPAEVITQIPG